MKQEIRTGQMILMSQRISTIRILWGNNQVQWVGITAVRIRLNQMLEKQISLIPEQNFMKMEQVKQNAEQLLEMLTDLGQAMKYYREHSPCSMNSMIMLVEGRPQYQVLHMTEAYLMKACKQFHAMRMVSMLSVLQIRAVRE